MSYLKKILDSEEVEYRGVNAPEKRAELAVRNRMDCKLYTVYCVQCTVYTVTFPASMWRGVPGNQDQA